MRGLPDIEHSLRMALMHVNEALAALTTLGMETGPQKATRNSLMLQLAQIRGTQAGLRDRTAREVEAEESAESAVDPVKVHLMVAALCAIYVRDAMVIAGRADVVGALSDPALRCVYLEQVATLATVAGDAMRMETLEGEDDRTIRDILGAEAISAAAREVSAAHDDYKTIERLMRSMDVEEPPSRN